jgi:hypothetical protein
MAKFNPGRVPQVVAYPITRLNQRNINKAIKAFSKFFNVDNDLEEVVSCAEWWGYTFGSSRKFVFLVEDGSEFAKMAVQAPEIWDLALSTDQETDSVLLIK